MIRRPVNAQFDIALWSAVKRTTIRPTEWPKGKDIMLYAWTGKPYRSPQREIAMVVVQKTHAITVEHTEDGAVLFHGVPRLPRVLWKLEGFNSLAELQAWFQSAIPKGKLVPMYLMQFEVVEKRNSISTRYFCGTCAVRARIAGQAPDLTGLDGEAALAHLRTCHNYPGDTLGGRRHDMTFMDGDAGWFSQSFYVTCQCPDEPVEIGVSTAGYRNTHHRTFVRK